MIKINKILPLLIIFLFAFTLPLNPPPSGWYQQFMPNLGGRQISDIFFLDSLTGWAVTPYLNINDTSYVLKTTNGGDNWFIQHSRIGQFVGSNKVRFLNSNTGYTAGASNLPAYSAVLKTTDGGYNWFNINPPTNPFNAEDISILNEDTFWTVMSEALTGGVFYTTNGGLNWTQQYFGGTSHIYMYNARIGFMDGGGLKRTTDGGFNWTQIPGEGLFSDMHFVDSLTGWKCLQSMKKTTDGGLTWINQILPSGGNIVLNYMNRFSCINKDTLWGVGGTVYFSGNGNRGMIFRTTNGGGNWLFQIPDSSIHIGLYSYIQFIDSKKGWAYSLLQGGVHTVTGGNDTFYTGLQHLGSEIPTQFKLYQNYPNPFNLRTIIKYEITSSKSLVKLVVYNITGREVLTLVNSMQDAGIYEVDFSGTGISSGVYFYKIIINSGKEVYTDTKKMILLK